MTLIERIDMGIARLEKGYLIKGATSDDAGGFCAIGSMLITGHWQCESGHEEVYAAIEAAGQAMGLEPAAVGYQPYGWAIANWNNAPERTKEEVIERLKRAKGVLQLEAEANKPQTEPVAA